MLVMTGVGVDRFASRVERGIAAAATAQRCQQIDSAAMPVSVASAVLRHDSENSGSASPGTLGAVLFGMFLMLLLLTVPLAALVLRTPELSQRCRLAMTKARAQLAEWAKPDASHTKQEVPRPAIDTPAAATTTLPDDKVVAEPMPPQKKQEAPVAQEEPVPQQVPISRRSYRDLRSKSRKPDSADTGTAQAESPPPQSPATPPITPVVGRRAVAFEPPERPAPRMLDVYDDVAASILSPASEPRRRLRRGYEEVRRGQRPAQRTQSEHAPSELDASPPPKASPSEASSSRDGSPASPASPASPPKADADKAKQAMNAFAKDMSKSSWLDFSSWQSPKPPARPDTSGASESEPTGSNVVSPAQPTTTETTETADAPPRPGAYRGRARLPPRSFKVALSLDL